jgi:hypothetical protein
MFTEVGEQILWRVITRKSVAGLLKRLQLHVHDFILNLCIFTPVKFYTRKKGDFMYIKHKSVTLHTGQSVVHDATVTAQVSCDAQESSFLCDVLSCSLIVFFLDPSIIQITLSCRSGKFLLALPAQSFLVPSPAGLTAIFKCLTTLGAHFVFKNI